MAWRSGVIGVLALVVVLSAGCEDDNLVTGPTPAGVTTGATVSIPGTSVPGASTTTTTTVPPDGAGGAAAVVTNIEVAVRQSAGGCWEVLAPGAPSGVSRQDLWYSSANDCQGADWQIAVQVFRSSGALRSASPASTAAATSYHDGTVLVLVAPSASVGARAVVSSQSGLVRGD